MFTEYHLEKIIEAINEAERRQTNDIVTAIKSMKADTIVEDATEEKIKITVHPELFTDELQDALSKEIEKAPVSPIKKQVTPKKPTATKKPAPVRGRN